MIYFFSTQGGSVIATQTKNVLTAEDVEKLCWLYGEATLVDGETVNGFFVGPRREMITPWSTNAVEITQNMGLEGIMRIEEYFPVKDENAAQHNMHTEHFVITRQTLQNILHNAGRIVAVGTTSVRTMESLAALAWRIKCTGTPNVEQVVGQWELYDIPAEFLCKDVAEVLLNYMTDNGLEQLKAATQIMITPLGYHFRIVNYIITNFHQPKSTLLLLVSAYVGDNWKRIYDYALANDFRFLSYGDSSLLKVY